MVNINTKQYWDNRFTHNWEKWNGRLQTRYFAEDQAPYLELPPNFDGIILDFGCGLGDAMPIYRKNFPKAKLIGMDISSIAIDKCREKYGNLAEFICGTAEDIPNVDVIISSNVFEHLSNDLYLAENILKKTKKLYIIVPYQESPLFGEHINSYSEDYFNSLGVLWFKTFYSRGWSEYGFRLFKLRIKNIFRYFFKLNMRPRAKQIMFCLSQIR